MNMRITKFVGAIEQSMLRGFLVISALAITGCVVEPDDSESPDEQELAAEVGIRLPMEVLGVEGTERYVD
ncbi:MAG: hypothetical protein ABI134_01490, partial [Byssovorax sp.]